MAEKILDFDEKIPLTRKIIEKDSDFAKTNIDNYFLKGKPKASRDGS